MERRTGNRTGTSRVMAEHGVSETWHRAHYGPTCPYAAGDTLGISAFSKLKIYGVYKRIPRGSSSSRMNSGKLNKIADNRGGKKCRTNSSGM